MMPIEKKRRGARVVESFHLLNFSKREAYVGPTHKDRRKKQATTLFVEASK